MESAIDLTMKTTSPEDEKKFTVSPTAQEEVFQSSSLSRRSRTAFTKDQVETLEVEFTKDKYLTRTKRLELAKRIHLSETTVKVWFQNRRMKNKRDKMLSKCCKNCSAKEEGGNTTDGSAKHAVHTLVGPTGPPALTMAPTTTPKTKQPPHPRMEYPIPQFDYTQFNNGHVYNPFYLSHFDPVFMSLYRSAYHGR